MADGESSIGKYRNPYATKRIHLIDNLGAELELSYSHGLAAFKSGNFPLLLSIYRDTTVELKIFQSHTDKAN